MKFYTWSWFASVVVRKIKEAKSLVASEQQQSSVWKCSSLTTDRHCCHAIVFDLASEHQTDQTLGNTAKNQECISSERWRRVLARHLYYIYSRTFQYYVHCSSFWRDRQIRWADMPVLPSIQKNNLSRLLYITPIL